MVRGDGRGGRPSTFFRISVSLDQHTFNREPSSLRTMPVDQDFEGPGFKHVSLPFVLCPLTPPKCRLDVASCSFNRPRSERYIDSYKIQTPEVPSHLSHSLSRSTLRQTTDPLWPLRSFGPSTSPLFRIPQTLYRRSNSPSCRSSTNRETRRTEFATSSIERERERQGESYHERVGRESGFVRGMVVSHVLFVLRRMS